jgi:hypothetical protein
MTQVHRWSVTLAGPSQGRPRWLDENGHFSSDPSRALRLANPEIAVQRIQAFLELHGSDPAMIERFRLVPAPPRIAPSRPTPSRSLSPVHGQPLQAA